MVAAAGRLLVFNAGSSSLKCAVYVLGIGAPTCLQRVEVSSLGSAEPEWHATPPLADGDRPALTAQHCNTVAHGVDVLLPWLLQRFGPFRGVGHRIVHGGPQHRTSAVIDPALLHELEDLVALAPLHQPAGLAAIRELTRLLPGLLQVAAFDTAFHRDQPAVAKAVALPAAVRGEDLQRYGFHGLNCVHVLAELTARAPRLAAGRVIVAHLGSGSSLTAMKAGHSLANSMGFTALDGLPMATRCGHLDPGILLALQTRGLDEKALEDLLYRRSGLLGLSGTTGDMRALLAREHEDDNARFALEYFAYHVVREMGAMAAVLGGLDALVFTGGIGARSAVLRARIVERIAWLGCDLDAGLNDRDAWLCSSARSQIACVVVPADEEAVIAADCARLISAP